MKKFVACLLCVCFALLFVSCGKEEGKPPFDVAESTLEQSNMSKSEYSAAEIETFAKRFTKIGLEKGFSRVHHFRSQTQYAYLIEFESESDAEKFYTTVGKSKYDIARSKNVVVYGDSAWIADIPFEE